MTKKKIHLLLAFFLVSSIVSFQETRAMKLGGIYTRLISGAAYASIAVLAYGASSAMKYLYNVHSYAGYIAAIKAGDIARVKAYIKAGYSSLYDLDRECNPYKKPQNHLMGRGDGLHYLNGFGANTPFFHGVRQGNIEMVKYMLEHEKFMYASMQDHCVSLGYLVAIGQGNKKMALDLLIHCGDSELYNRQLKSFFAYIPNIIGVNDHLVRHLLYRDAINLNSAVLREYPKAKEEFNLARRRAVASIVSPILVSSDKTLRDGRKDIANIIAGYEI